MKQILFDNSILTKNVKKSFLKKKVNKGDVEIEVDSDVGFDTDQILLLGELGNETSEILHTSATTEPADNIVTLENAASYAHPQGEPVHIIEWDQVVVYHSDTEEDSKELLATIKAQVDSLETIYVDQTKSDGFYFTRLRNSIDEILSDYSDPIPNDGYDSNRVGNIIDYALKRNKLKTYTEFIDHDFCIEEINSCLKYIKGKLKKWSKLQEFGYSLGKITRGKYSFELPEMVWSSSFKSILNVRLEGGLTLKYLDKKEFDDLFYGTYIKELESPATTGDTEIELDNTVGLKDEGVVNIKGNKITYEGIDGNKLTGIPPSGSGSITESFDEGENVWHGAVQEAQPRYFTVYGGKMYIYPLTSASEPERNLIVDFWTEAPEINSDYDKIDIYRYDMVKHWLTWAVRMEAKNDGERVFEDGDYQQFEQLLADARRGEIHGQKLKTEPNLNQINYNSTK